MMHPGGLRGIGSIALRQLSTRLPDGHAICPGR